MDVRRQLLGLLVCLVVGDLARGAAEADVPALDLADCLVIAEERQPSLHAWRASLQAAIVRKEAVDQLRVPGILFNRDLRVRRTQAKLGVVVAQSSLHQENHETAYDVTRTYFSVVYARLQLRLVREVIKDMTAYRKTVEDVLLNKKVPFSDMAHDLISLYLAEARSR
ncbi:MAG: hypothetical protein AB7K24_22800, partial [Gemmataceae bacterium]